MPALVLFFLAPAFGEFLLGNLRFSELFYLPFIAPLYGGGAILIREIARRAGRGYATMLTLGAAYSLFEEAIVDQLLFNPDYFAGQRELMETVIPGTGVDAWLVLILFAMHALWSTVIPIVLVEALFSKRGKEPWLGNIGLSIVVAVFVVGSAWLGWSIYDESGFLASPWQLAGASAAVALLVVAAFTVNRPGRTRSSLAPNPWFAGAVAFVASSLYMLTEYVPGWFRVAACVLLAVAFFTLLWHWAHRTGWTQIDTLAVAGGAILTYAWLGSVMVPESGPKTMLDHIGTGLLVLGALALVARAAYGLSANKLGRA